MYIYTHTDSEKMPLNQLKRHRVQGALAQLSEMQKLLRKVCVCVCVCVRERESVCVCVCEYQCWQDSSHVCVCECVRAVCVWGG